MRFDDRLSTVLAQPATDAHDRAVRWRQLVELLARSGGAPVGRLAAEALAEVKDGAGAIDPAVRAATARAVSAMPLSAELVAIFAADTLTIAAPVLAAASLNGPQWDVVLTTASEENLRFLLTLHPELQGRSRLAAMTPQTPLTPAAPTPASPPAPAPAAEPESPIPSISDVVARIERLRQSREQEGREAPAPGDRLPTGGALFRWECTPSGEIAWVDGAPRGALVGRSIAQPSEQDHVDPAVGRAFSVRAPFRDASLVLAGDADWAGEWKISGAPAFEPADGRFAGYRGVATRTGVSAAAGLAHWGDHDSLRELIHEIKTPLNAIIGFAEIIDGEFLGEAGVRYRERAAVIVEEARLLLGAIDDLDLAARLQSGREQVNGPVDADEMLARLRPQLIEQAEQSGVTLEFEAGGGGRACAVHPVLAERMVTRMVEVVVSAAAEGERLSLMSGSTDGRCTLTARLPAALRDAVGKAGGTDRAGPHDGESFRLRLLHGLAQLGGGDVAVTDGHLKLTLPRG